MPDTTYKKVEIVGTSTNSVSEAIQVAITKASESIRHIDWYEVVEIRGFVKKAVCHHQVVLKVGFRLD